MLAPLPASHDSLAVQDEPQSHGCALTRDALPASLRQHGHIVRNARPIRYCNISEEIPGEDRLALMFTGFGPACLFLAACVFGFVSERLGELVDC